MLCNDVNDDCEGVGFWDILNQALQARSTIAIAKNMLLRVVWVSQRRAVDIYEHIVWPR